ncbi:MAG TPA: hypothetical protein VEI52_25765 [Terriglobales bacterium]|nr:hypothetical protein [Terriglobales bacterium]
MAQSFRQRLLYAWLPRPSVIAFVENQCVEEEIRRKDEILRRWEAARQEFTAKAPRSFETVSFKAIEDNYSAKLDAIRNDRRFAHTFQQFPTTFEIVEIDKLIACQATVTMDYAAKLRDGFPERLDLDALIDICLSLDKTVPEVSDIRINEQTIIYSSENTDFRFLGAIDKPLAEINLDTSSTGGIPTRGLVMLFGYGGSPINVLRVGARIFLHNGFHRVYALRSAGVTEIPVVVQTVHNPALEFPAQYQNIPKDYLLTADHLPMMEDYLNENFVIDLRSKARRRGIKVVVIAEPIDVPL